MIISTISISSIRAEVVEGVIYDQQSREPIPYVSIRVENTTHSIMSNAVGAYRLKLKSGDYRLTFSHIGHFSHTELIEISSEDIQRDIFLNPDVIELEGTKVYSRAFDPAQEIIIEAIRRKEEILNKIKNYQFEAYTKLVVRDTAKVKPKDIVIITETQLEGYWKHPDRYKEILIARRQTSNMNAENNLVTIGEILNFNQSRLEVGAYKIMSPTATDALDHYNYYLLDTVEIDGVPAFRLEVEPKNNYSPLFQGTIDIADSSYAIVGVNVGFSKGVETDFVKNLIYVQRFALFENEYWMPNEISMTADFKIGIPGVPDYHADYIASLYSYKIEIVAHKSVFNDYLLEVDEDADKVDSTDWYSGQVIPLTEQEITSYNYIDSVKHAPKPLHKKLSNGSLILAYIAAFKPEFFHFNRVEGPYLGIGLDKLDLTDRLSANFKTGYAFEEERWENRIGFVATLHKEKRFRFRFNYHDEIMHRPTILSHANSNSTLLAISNKTDPFDYYLEKGFDASVVVSPTSQFSFSAGIIDANQYSVAKNTEYSFFRENKLNRINPMVADGKVRKTVLQMGTDSRKLMKIKKNVYRVFSPTFTKTLFSWERSSPDFLDSDFDYNRYTFRLWRSQRVLDLGISNLFVYLGSSSGKLPPQSYHLLEFNGDLFAHATEFHTLGENIFNGDRAAAVYIEHDFGLALFRKLKIPVLRDLPTSFSVHGGAFWTEFHNSETIFVGQIYQTAEKPYSEFGFGLGKIPPLRLVIRFTWQLSDYDTNDFSFSIGSVFSP